MISKRAKRKVSLSEFSAGIGGPEEVIPLKMNPPEEKQYILRMCIRAGGNYTLPDEVHWIAPMLYAAALDHNIEIINRHDFCYLTIRHGVVESVLDDEWHLDGFSTRIEHPPEQNYVWCNNEPTEYVDNMKVAFPEDFDPLVHNVNHYLQKFVRPENVKQMKPGTLYCMDPYILHRRPPTAIGMRTFVRLSFVPIMIDDINNTQNPLLPQTYTKDGLLFRNNLKTY